ncbi:MAG: hypothetical protein AAGA81_01400 [Acidobacteriota bacterium]
MAASDPAKTELRSDCSRCAGLCCVAPAFSAGPEFALDKSAHAPCPHLQDDFRCGIHERLREHGFSGCVVFECYGAGQRVTQRTFGGRDWRTSPEIAKSQFEAFRVVRPLHEQLMFLDEALKLEASWPLEDELRRLYDEVDAAASSAAEDLETIDVAQIERRVHELLLRVGELVRSA